MSIPDNLIPVHVLDMVRDAETFSVETWRTVVRSWVLVTIKFALVARSKSEAERANALRKGAEDFDKTVTNAANTGDDAARTCAAVLCLSDAALDKLFEAFDLEGKLADLSRPVRKRLLRKRAAQN